MKRYLLILLLVLTVSCFATFTGFSQARLTTLEVTSTSILRGAATFYNVVLCGSFTGDFDLNSYFDLDTTDDTYYAANIATTGNGGGLYVNSSGTGDIFAFAHDGTTQFSMKDGGGFVFGGASKPVKRLYLPIDVGGGTADTETFMNSPSINIDTDDETFYASVPVPADWDGASDMVLCFAIANEIAETDGDDVIITLQIKGDADGEAMAANGQAPTCTLDLTGGDEAINVVNLSTATIDYNEATYPIAVDDVLKIKCSIGLGTGTEITGPTHIVAWWVEYTADQLTQ